VTTASFSLLPVAVSSVSARATLRTVLGDWADEGIRADAALLLTELVANCVRHARSPMQIRLTVEHDRLRAEVRDGSALNPLPREPDEHGGRGVLILDALASRWGVSEHPGAGKTVWFELAGCELAASPFRVAS
jgi:serine/threonine-protein kinase RsbW